MLCLWIIAEVVDIELVWNIEGRPESRPISLPVCGEETGTIRRFRNCERQQIDRLPQPWPFQSAVLPETAMVPEIRSASWELVAEV